jgi:hypothetical protein
LRVCSKCNFDPAIYFTEINTSGVPLRIKGSTFFKMCITHFSLKEVLVQDLYKHEWHNKKKKEQRLQAQKRRLQPKTTKGI